MDPGSIMPLLALRQPYDCLRAREVILKDEGKISQYQTTATHNKTQAYFLGMYSIFSYQLYVSSNQH